MRNASKYLTTLSKSLEKPLRLWGAHDISIFVSPLLHRVHHLPIDCAQDGVDDQEEKELAADQLVQRTCTIVMYNLTLPRSCI